MGGNRFCPYNDKIRNRYVEADSISAQNGITLIALIITIIIMLILAGVAISLTLGENGLFSTAKYAVIKTEEEKAREKLELALADLQSQKYLGVKDSIDEDIDNYLESKQMVVMQDKVTVDGWQFEIDRTVPKIIASLGKGKESSKIKINSAVENSIDYTKATIKIEIITNEEIKNIQINGEEVTIPQKVDGKYSIEKEVQNNGNYIVIVKNTNDEYKTEKISVTEISEDMNIQTAEQLVTFRDRVNKGATYKDRTINVVNNIDLSKVCYKVDGTIQNDKSWIPIGNYQEEGENSTHIFKGTFNGNNHKIEGLYINSDKDYQGLFGCIENATITGVIIEGIKDKEAIDDSKITSIKGNKYVGAISAYIKDNSKIQNCGNNAQIISTGYYVAGIVGYIENSNLEGCYNKANVTSTNSDGFVAGIAGSIWSSSAGEYYIKNSYNNGNITGASFVGGIAGDIGTDAKANIFGTLSNCYNKGIITGTESGRVGGITGRNFGKVLLEYCFNLGEINNNEGINVGGLVGVNRLHADATSNMNPTINHCYNVANVISTGNTTQVGGLVGSNAQYAYVKNCMRLITAEVKNGSIVSGFGGFGTSSNNYTGRLIGNSYSNSTPYIENVSNYEEGYIPTVYNVMNGLSDDKSLYWSITNVNEPKLLWEK